MIKIKQPKKFTLFFLLAVFLIFCLPLLYKEKEQFKRLLFKGKDVSFLNYQDLVKISSTAKPSSESGIKLQRQLNIPYISNKIFSKQKLKKQYIRVAHWNIAQGINVETLKSIFSGNQNYYYNYRKNLSDKSYEAFKKELLDLASSDLILLNEADIGIPRTDYKNIAGELAHLLGYNYAFATEFIELSPVIYKLPHDPQKYLGLHGNIILSRFPIVSARIVRLPDCYKWYETELQKKSPIETIRRAGAKVVFEQEITSEVRHGSRCALIADVKIPSYGTLTVVSTHLEDRCYSDCRHKQIEYLFENIKFIRNPLVLAGDLNTSATDSTPTSVTKEVTKRVRDRDFIMRQIALALIPLGLPVPGLANLATFSISKALQYKDPASPNIPVLFPNHERKIFKYIKEFKFADGESFDVSGDSDKSSNRKKGLFANSNERQLKGFESTFQFEEPRVIAYFKLDWFFVKPKNGRFRPFNGQTLQLVNHAYPGRVSDHEPMIVDLNLYNTM